MDILFVSFPTTKISLLLVDLIMRLLSAVLYHLYTAILFTWTDYKTIFFPIVSSSRYDTLDMLLIECRPSLLAQQHP